MLCITGIYAQPGLPQRQITVLPIQPLQFGVFFVRSVGTIEVNYQGTNAVTTGGVFSVDDTSVTPAVFEIKLCQGRIVAIDYPAFVWLTGSNGGAPLKLILGSAKRDGSGTILERGDTFPVDTNCNFLTILRVGGTLEVPANAVPGFYSGNFPVTFTQQ